MPREDTQNRLREKERLYNSVTDAAIAICLKEGGKELGIC